MLSKSSVKLLKWMNANDEWMYYRKIEKCCPVFEYRAFNALETNKYTDTHIDEFEVPEVDEQCLEVTWPVQYRISSAGKAYLEFRASDRWKEFRNWISLLIAVAAFVKSFFLLG
ncbi:hypothetical protein [Oscillibacter sp.]|uniref:hypothetical protein n=1 Tax=Oscillibacter sp. TaxID=1945593 RepID=UPI0025D1BBD9|nr:hypothetical protein [Oscillibacter sp.]